MRRLLPVAILVMGCGSTVNPFGEPPDSAADGAVGGDGAVDAVVMQDGVTPVDGTSEDGTIATDGAMGTDTSVSMNDGGPVEPTTCAEAAAAKSNVGCDFWPTVVANNVWSIFDYAVVVANAGTADAQVTVIGPGGVTRNVTVTPGTLQTVYLPWVPALKGTDTNECGSAVKLAGSVFAQRSAYHLVATRPVTVYQFSPLEYKPIGGPAGKDWSTCPGTTTTCTSQGDKIGCFAYSSDASLLLPSTSMTGNYRVVGIHGWSTTTGTTTEVMNSYVTITATQNATAVKLVVSPTGHVLAGGTAIPATSSGGTLDLLLDEGDVVQLAGQPNQASDLSGSLITANKPIQVIAGIPCQQMPTGTSACDHMEESIFPAETFGKDYFVTVPTAPTGKPVSHTVRLYGNRDGTILTYAPAKPSGAPDTLAAGQVVTLTTVTADFRVTGDKEFAVASFQHGGQKVDPTATVSRGDPSMSLTTPLEQWRRRYIFLAPLDFDTSYADVVYPNAATVKIDGVVVTGGAPIGSTGFSIARVKLLGGAQGAHELVSTSPVGMQVMGYGSYTSYQYPGGVDLRAIAAPPVK